MPLYAGVGWTATIGFVEPAGQTNKNPYLEGVPTINMSDKLKKGSVYLVAKTCNPSVQEAEGENKKEGEGGKRSVFNICIHGDLSKQIQKIPHRIRLRH